MAVPFVGDDEPQHREAEAAQEAEQTHEPGLALRLRELDASVDEEESAEPRARRNGSPDRGALDQAACERRDRGERQAHDDDREPALSEVRIRLALWNSGPLVP